MGPGERRELDEMQVACASKHINTCGIKAGEIFRGYTTALLATGFFQW